MQPNLIFDHLSNYRPFNASFPPPPTATTAKFAIFISGASRTFGQTWPSILRTWLSEPNADLYVVINVPESPKSWDCLQFLPLFMHPGLRHFSLYRHEHEEIIRKSDAKYGSLGITPSQPSRFIIDQTYYLKLGWDALTTYLKRWNMPDYEMIVRLRPDVYYPEPDRVMRLDYLHERMLTIPAEKGRYLTPKYLGYGGVSDQLGIMDMAGARVAFTLYDRAINLSKTVEWGPEVITAVNLERNGVLHQNFEDLYTHIGEGDSELIAKAGGPSFEISGLQNRWSQSSALNPGGFRLCLLRLNGVCELRCMGHNEMNPGTTLQSSFTQIDYQTK